MRLGLFETHRQIEKLRSETPKNKILFSDKIRCQKDNMLHSLSNPIRPVACQQNITNSTNIFFGIQPILFRIFNHFMQI